MLKVVSSEDRERTHVFGTYFFYTLSRKLSQHFDDEMSEEEKLHSKVKKWTKGVNIFEKDFIIIPIHDWYVFIFIFIFLRVLGSGSLTQNFDPFLCLNFMSFCSFR
jgi:Ulp1 family protease